MAKHSITVEIEDQTFRFLASLGDPVDVLARLLDAVGDGFGRRGPQREQTDESLRVERDKADDRDAEWRRAVEEAADAVVRIARRRADRVLQTAQDAAYGERPAQSSLATKESAARNVLERERSDADTTLEHERAERRRYVADALAAERETTDSDLTGERSQADSVLLAQREANEQMVRATIRAHDLAEEAQAARDLAEESQRELRSVAEFREMFIGVLGHDLRNPLGSIVMAAALMLRRDNLDEQDARIVERIIRSSHRMTRMITQLLDLTRARLGGGLPIEPKPMDLRDLCRNIVDELDAAVQLDAEGDLTGTWDEDRLAEVLSNLAGNAVDHAAPGTVVNVKGYADGAEVVVEVSNQGDPIPADVLPSIFEPFRRAESRQKSPTGNLGLGLYIAQQIVFSHGGTLDVRSADGTTTFVMRLPRLPPNDPGGAP